MDLKKINGYFVMPAKIIAELIIHNKFRQPEAYLTYLLRSVYSCK